MPGLEYPDADRIDEGIKMLETNIDRWEAQAIAKGDAAGDSTRHATKGIQRGCSKGCRGIQQGVQQGIQPGRGLVVATPAHRRFGELSAAQQARLPPPRLPSWKSGAIRVLDAASLDEVFGDTRH